MRQEERRARTLAAVHRAAMEAFARGGYAETSLDTIAGAAGVSKGAVYAYYPAKLDLFLAVADVVLDDARRRLGRVGEEIERRARPERAAARYLGDEGDSQHVSVMAELWRMATVEEAVRERLESFRGERLAELGKHAVRAGRPAGEAMREAEIVAKLIDAETLDRRLETAAKFTA